jgi:hypothetical protein
VPLPTSESRSPVVFFSNGVGDRLLSLPALRALVQLFGPRLTLLSDAAASQFFHTQLNLPRIVDVVHVPGNRRLFDAERAAHAVTDCDLFMSLVPWSSDALVRLVEALAPRGSIGFGPLFDVCLARDYTKHSADLAFDLPRSLDPSLAIDAFAAPLELDGSVRQRSRALLAPLPASVRLLAVHADTLPEKTWLPDRMAETVDRFLARHADVIVFLVGMRDCVFAGGGSRPRVVNCCGLPLDLTMAVIAASDLFLGVDSCMLHAADLSRVEGVGLFGPTSAAEFGFRFGPHRHVQAAAMNGIAVDDALTALEAMWRLRDRRQPRRDGRASTAPRTGDRSAATRSNIG